MYYNNGTEGERQKQKPSALPVILVSVLGTLVVVGLMIALFFWGQEVGRSQATNKSSSSLSSISSASTQSSTASSSSSQPTPVVLTTFTDPVVKQFTLKYNSKEWVSASSLVKPSDLVNSTIFTHIASSSKLTVLVYELPPTGFTGENCVGPDQIVDVGGGWYRIRKDDDSRVYVNKINVTLENPSGFTADGNPGPCPANKNAASTLGFTVYERNGKNYLLNIALQVVGDNRAVADEVVKSIEFK